MKRLSDEAKQQIIKKALTNSGQSIAEIAATHNIGYSTLQKWLSLHRQNTSSTGGPQTPMTTAERFNHLVATAGLDEAAVGAYCRERGIFSFQLAEWKNEFMSNERNPKKQLEHAAELKALRLENKRLTQDLARKEKALAETAALLVLKKKADLIWGENEDA